MLYIELTESVEYIGNKPLSEFARLVPTKKKDDLVVVTISYDL